MTVYPQPAWDRTMARVDRPPTRRDRIGSALALAVGAGMLGAAAALALVFG